MHIHAHASSDVIKNETQMKMMMSRTVRKQNEKYLKSTVKKRAQAD